MRALLLIAVIFFPLTLAGKDLKCYFSVESKYMKTERIPVPCSSDCARGEAPLPDGDVMTMRGCHEMFSQLSEHFESGTMTADQKAALEGLSSDRIHLCKEDLCNGASSVISTVSLLLLVATIAAISIF